MLNSKDSYSKGAKVLWKWGRGKVKGTVKEVYFHTIEKEIKGGRIKRKASAENPAYFIKEDNKDKYVSLLNQLCKFSHKYLKFYPQILSKNEP